MTDASQAQLSPARLAAKKEATLRRFPGGD